MARGRRSWIRGAALLWVGLGALLYLVATRSDRAPPADSDGPMVLDGGCLGHWVDPEPAPSAGPRSSSEACPVWPPHRANEVVVDVVGLRQWTPDHALPMDLDERERLAALVSICDERWGDRICKLRPCVVQLAIQHDLPGHLVWVDGAWRLRDPTGYEPPSELLEESWFYLEPGAVRLPDRRAPLGPDDCSVFERVRLVPHRYCDAWPEQVTLDWELGELRLDVGGGRFTADEVEAHRRYWQETGLVGR